MLMPHPYQQMDTGKVQEQNHTEIWGWVFAKGKTIVTIGIIITNSTTAISWECE